MFKLKLGNDIYDIIIDFGAQHHLRMNIFASEIKAKAKTKKRQEKKSQQFACTVISHNIHQNSTLFFDDKTNVNKFQECVQLNGINIDKQIHIYSNRWKFL